MSDSTSRFRLKPILLAAASAVLVSVLGMLSTDLGGWYQSLAKPSWQPPDWVFGPVWTLIYALAALAAVSAWHGARSTAARTRVLTLFAINAFLNVLWSLLFFGLKRPDWALVEVAFLWLSIIALIVGLRQLSKATTWLLLPYLLWVAFAAVLNAAVLGLNPGL